jgi:hypothetical protein
MSRCGGCGGRENPKEAVVVGPAVILGNGAVVPFNDDASMDRWVARKAARGETRLTVVREGDTRP